MIRKRMGNLFGTMAQAVHHPWKIKPTTGGGSPMRIKVRMTRRELKELMGKVESSKGRSELGRLIMRELSTGRFQARVLACGDLMMPTAQRREPTVLHLNSIG